MKEQLSSEALVVSMRPVRDNDQLVTFLTKNEGLLQATLFGGRKSHLRNFVLQWNSGTLFYNKGKKPFITIEDFVVENYHSSVYTNITKLRLCSACEEIVIASKSIATSESYWKWVIGFIDGLDLCNSDYSCVTAFLRFVWRYLYLMGQQPDLSVCQECGSPLIKNKLAPSGDIQLTAACQSDSDFVFYDKSEHEFLCRSCAISLKKGNLVKLSITAVSYLDAVMSCDYKITQTIRLNKSVVGELYSFLVALIEEACESRIYSLNGLKLY